MVAFFASRVASRKALLYSLLSRYMRNGLYLRRLMAKRLWSVRRFGWLELGFKESYCF